MNSKMLMKCADIFIESGYAGSKAVRLKPSTLCVLTNEGRTVEVNPLADTLDGRKQLDVLEKHYRVCTHQNEQGDVNVSDVDDIRLVAGNDPRHSRMAFIEMRLRVDTIKGRNNG